MNDDVVYNALLNLCNDLKLEIEDRNISRSIKEYKKDSKIKTKILDINVEKERISLGIKQLKADAFNDFISSNKKGSKVSGKVSSYTDEVIALDLSEGVSGKLSQKDFVNSSLEVTLEEGIEMEVIVANINKKEREIILSLRALEKAEERTALKENIQKNKEIEEASKSNLGDMIKAEIDESEDEKI